MSEKEQIAIEAYKRGCNCAQAVVSAYAEELGLDEKQARRLMEGFGGGFGGMQEVCGAFSGACMAISYLNSDGSAEAKTKKNTYKYIKEAAQEFKDKQNSIICFEILESKPPVHLKCSEVITDAVKLVEDYLQKEKENLSED